MTDRGNIERKRLPFLVWIQVAIALLSLLVLAFVAFRIGPMLEEKQRLEREIGEYRAEIEAYQEQIDELESQLRETRRQLAMAEQRLRETADMSRFSFPVDLVDVKALASRHPGPAEALTLILEMRNQGVGWHLGGQRPDEGFDSPGFAAFVLHELGMLQEPVEPGESLLATSRRLFERLPPARDPAIGDIAFYPAGYVLFRFENETGQPYVIGMTPMGIAALKPDFAEPVGLRRSGLSR